MHFARIHWLRSDENAVISVCPLVSVTRPTSVLSRKSSTCGEVEQPERVPTVVTVNGGSIWFGKFSVFSNTTFAP